jgi:hypothetical protein
MRNNFFLFHGFLPLFCLDRDGLLLKTRSLFDMSNAVAARQRAKMKYLTGVSS